MTSIIYVIILIGSVVLHELAHAWTAYKLGDPTAWLEGRITFNPLAHLDMFGSVILPLLLVLTGSPFIIGWAKPVPFNPHNFSNPKWGAALVAVMGPVTNILIALVAAGILLVVPVSSLILTAILQVVIITNIALAVFNMVPIPPLDGHHILFALIPDRYASIKYQLQKYSMGLVIVFVIFGWKFIEPLVSWLFELLV
jgi:Zn-dependent protease